jgi:hypothetical protein
LFSGFSDRVHWQEKQGVRETFMQWHSTESKKEETMTMSYFKHLLPKTILLGSIGFALMLLGGTPSSKAQEVSPAHFTDTGVEDYYPAKKPLAKKTAKVQMATNPRPLSANEAIARKQKVHRVARKQNVVSAPSI